MLKWNIRTQALAIGSADTEVSLLDLPTTVRRTTRSSREVHDVSPFSRFVTVGGRRR